MSAKKKYIIIAVIIASTAILLLLSFVVPVHTETHSGLCGTGATTTYNVWGMSLNTDDPLWHSCIGSDPTQ